MASIFSGKAGRNASVASNMLLHDGMTQANDQISAGKGNAAGYLNQNPELYQGAYDKAQGLLDSAYQDAKSSMSGSGDYYQPFYNTGVSANTAYANAMGLNGAEGYQEAQNNFRVNPGYQFQMDQALDAVNRNAAARGGLASGNNTVDLMTRAQGLADQSWNNYLSGLNTSVNTGMQAAQGLSNTQQNLSSLASNYGAQGASLAQGLGDRLAGNNSSLASNEMGAAGLLANNLMNTYGQIASNTGQGMMAGQTAAQNRFGLGMGLANSAMGLLGGLMK